MAAMGLITVASLSSCEDILGKWEQPAPIVPVPEKVVTLGAALEDGALITVTVNISDVPTEVTFKKVGDTYVYQAPSAGTRGIVSPVYTLTYVEASKQLLFSVKKSTGELVFGITINMTANTFTILASSDLEAASYSFSGGIVVNGNDLSSSVTKDKDEKLVLTVQDLTGKALGDITALTVSDAKGAKVASAEESAGWLTVNKADMANGDYWFEATTAEGRKYIAKVTVDTSKSNVSLEMATWGNYIGSDGKFYATTAAAEAVGKKAAALIAYIGDDADTSEEGKTYHGLAFALQNVTCDYAMEVRPGFNFPVHMESLKMNGIAGTNNMCDSEVEAARNPGKKVRAYSVEGFTPATYGFSDWFIASIEQFYKSVNSLCSVEKWGHSGGDDDPSQMYAINFDLSALNGDEFYTLLMERNGHHYMRGAMRSGKDFDGTSIYYFDAPYHTEHTEIDGEDYAAWVQDGDLTDQQIRPFLAF